MFLGSHKSQKFCSNECKHKNHTITNTIKCKCDYCGKDIVRIKSEYIRRDNHYCSEECKNNHHSLNMTGENHPRWSAIKCKCDYCGRELYRNESRYNSNQYNYCNSKCLGLHKSMIALGENNSNWRGGLSDKTGKLYNILRNSTIEEWRNESIKECNGKCVITKRNYECVHHLYSHNLIVEEVLDTLNLEVKDIEEYTSNEIIMMKQTCLELHYKYGLGVCLTNDMHDKFHTIYGYGNNTPKQFDEFLIYIKNQSA